MIQHNNTTHLPILSSTIMSPVQYALKSNIFCKVNKNNGSPQTSNTFRRKSLFTSKTLVVYHCCRLQNRITSFPLIESKCTFVLSCSRRGGGRLSPFRLVIVNYIITGFRCGIKTNFSSRATTIIHLNK